MRVALLSTALAALAPLASAQSDRGGAALDERIGQAASAAQRLQGSLDGGWRVASPDGRSLYAVQIVQRAGGGPLEGVWRDLRRAPVPGDIAMIDRLEQRRGRLVLLLGAAVLDLHPGAQGQWRGVLRQDRAVSQVIMRRNEPAAGAPAPAALRAPTGRG